MSCDEVYACPTKIPLSLEYSRKANGKMSFSYLPITKNDNDKGRQDKLSIQCFLIDKLLEINNEKSTCYYIYIQVI